MPTRDPGEEILLQPVPSKVSQTSDSDSKKNLAPPSRRVVRPAASEASDVIRHTPKQAASPAPKPAAKPQPKAQAAPVPSDAISESRAEFAAAAARARAAVAEQQKPREPEPKPAPAAKEAAARLKIPPRRTGGQAPLSAAAEAPVQAPAPVETPPPVQRQAPPAPAPQPAPVAAPEPAPAQVRAKRPEVISEPEPTPAAQEQPRRQQRVDSSKGFLLHTQGLKKVYDGRAVVNGVEVTVRPSEIVGLLGPNGAGKTTSFYMIVGLVQPNGGTVTFDGKDATNEPMYRRARLGMGYLPQEESIFRKLSVVDNILAVMETQADIPRSERRDRAQELMKRFGIERLAKNEAITLSGGEKRRLTIARSLVTNPKLLMLDEPFSGVDPIAVGEIQDIVRDLREQGLAILITDHNVRETLGIVDRAYLLVEGKVIREGTRDFLMNDELSRKLYLGEEFSM